MKAKAKAKKKKLTPLRALLNKCQRVFNLYVRLRDKGNLCISCGSSKANQAGHYFPVRQYSALRFDEINVNLQCAYCNAYLHGNQANYRMGLVKKVGEDVVHELEEYSLMQREYRWSRVELDQKIENYVARVKELNAVQV